MSMPHDEPILIGPPGVGSHAVAFHEVVKYNDAQVKVFWNANELDLSNDKASFKTLPPIQQELVKKILGFFVVGDDIVGEHLSASIRPHVSRFELLNFLATQEYIERVHMQAYDRLIREIVDSPQEVEQLRRAIENFPSIAALTHWVADFMPGGKAPIHERIAAFVMFEGLIFSAAFAFIYWLRAQGKCPGLCGANDWIARDEGIHTQTWAYAYRCLQNKASKERCADMIRSAVNALDTFVSDVLPEPIGILSTETMGVYVRSVANSVSGLLGHGNIYDHAINPFQFMVNINLQNNTDLFVAPVTEYIGVGGMGSDPSFESVFGDDE